MRFVRCGSSGDHARDFFVPLGSSKRIREEAVHAGVAATAPTFYEGVGLEGEDGTRRPVAASAARILRVASRPNRQTKTRAKPRKKKRE